MRLAICYCSRGMGHDRTIAGVIREVSSVDVEPVWCWSFGLPIPDAQNDVTRQALAADADALWFVENDHLLPVGVVHALLAHDAPVVAANYLLRSGVPCAITNERTGVVELVGLGCTLIRTEVFAHIPDPPFQVGNRFTWDGGEWRDTGVPEHMGGQDVTFCRAVRAAGMQIAVLPGVEVGHLETIRRGDHVNYGMDQIICHGGAGDLPWLPPKRRPGMGKQIFIKSPGGTVMDMDEDKAGPWFDRGWVRINKSDFTTALKAQNEFIAQKKAEIAAEEAATNRGNLD